MLLFGCQRCFIVLGSYWRGALRGRMLLSFSCEQCFVVSGMCSCAAVSGQSWRADGTPVRLGTVF